MAKGSKFTRHGEVKCGLLHLLTTKKQTKQKPTQRMEKEESQKGMINVRRKET
jgi:hypothetical protein